MFGVIYEGLCFIKVGGGGVVFYFELFLLCFYDVLFVFCDFGYGIFVEMLKDLIECVLYWCKCVKMFDKIVLLLFCFVVDDWVVIVIEGRVGV